MGESEFRDEYWSRSIEEEVTSCRREGKRSTRVNSFFWRLGFLHPLNSFPFPSYLVPCLRLLCSLLDDLLLLFILIPPCFTFSLNPTFLDASAAILTTSQPLCWMLKPLQ